MSPLDEYSQRLTLRERSKARWDTHSARIEMARLGVAALFLILVCTSLARGTPSSLWLLLPTALFLALLVYHQPIRTRQALAARAVAYYADGIERLKGRRQARDIADGRFVDEHHLYGADLDLFGAQGLYRSLCTARTPMGEATLASWLLNPADLQTIHDRHSAIAELRRRADLREDLALQGDLKRIELHAVALGDWVRAPDELWRPWLRPTGLLLTLLAAAGAVVWAVWDIVFPFLAVLVIEAGITYALRDRVRAAVQGVEHAYEDLKLLSTLLRRIESEPFEAAPLRALKAKLASHAMPASITLSRLATLVNFVEARRNPFLVPLMLPLMYTVQAALAAERWRRLHGQVVESWLSALGDMEALLSLATYSFEHPDDPFPEFAEGPAAFQATGLGHPLISRDSRVRNDVELAGPTRVLLVSGSNMSGKSTLLRSVGINTVLAMAGAPVCATRLRLTPLQVGASIRVNDSLYEGSSRFYAEITRLRQLFEPSRLPLVFLLDELLQGTNSTDRRIGAQGVLRALLDRGAIGLISTHDLAISDGLDIVPGALRNVHFQDELIDGKLKFDFKLRDGIVTKSNGIELMRAIGLDV
jgi:hypothetical protein